MPAHCVSVVKMASSLILKVFVVGNLKGKEQHGWMDGCALRVMHVLQNYIMCLEIYRIIFEMLQILSKRCWAVKVLHMDEGTLSSQYDPSSSIFIHRYHHLQQSSSIMSNHYVHLWTKQVVGFLGGSHHNWDHFPSSDHVEELLSYVIRAVVILKR